MAELGFFLSVFLILVVARVFGETLQRVKQPALVGELLAGVLIGPTILNVVQPSADLTLMANVALFFIMFLTGLNLHAQDIVDAGPRAAVISVLAFVVPFVSGAYVASLFGLTLVESLVVGLTLAITAVPVNSIILMEFGMLKTKLGATVITAGVIDDIMSLVVLGVILQIAAGDSTAAGYVGVLTAVGKVGVFLIGVLLAYAFLRKNPRWARTQLERFGPRLKTTEAEFGVMVTFSMGVSILAMWSGLHFIIGTFFAGLLLNEAMGDNQIVRDTNLLSGITFGFFAPILFGFIGTEFNGEALWGVMALFAVLLAVAIAGKLVGGYAGAALAGFSRPDRSLIALLLNSRGFVELVIATIAYQAGLIDTAIFSIVVAVGVITTALSPITARVAISRHLRPLARERPAPEADKETVLSPAK